MQTKFVKHIKALLQTAQQTLQESPNLKKETGSINPKGQQTIAMDAKIEQLFVDYAKKHKLPVKIFSEEIGELDIHNNPKYYLVFDPLDGSTNYKIGKNLLPYGTLITVFEGLEPKLNNIIAAGALEFTHQQTWLYDGQTTTNLSDNSIKLSNNWDIEPATPIYLDTFYQAGYQAYMPLAQKIFIRNTGATIGNLALFLNDVAAGMGGACMRAEEVGAVYALVKGAGGIAIDHAGNDIGIQAFHPETTYQILAGNPNIMQFTAEKIS